MTAKVEEKLSGQVWLHTCNPSTWEVEPGGQGLGFLSGKQEDCCRLTAGRARLSLRSPSTEALSIKNPACFRYQ